jgi:hypothetical protein
VVLAAACGSTAVSAGSNEAFSTAPGATHGSGAPSRPGSSAPSGTGGGLALPAGSAAELAAAADKTKNQRSATFTVTFNQVTANGEVPYATGTGKYDSSRSDTTLNLAAGAGGGGGDASALALVGGPIELITDGSTVYLKSSLLGGALGGGAEWISIDQGDQAQTGFGASVGSVLPFGGQVNPESFLDSLRGAGEVTQMGDDVIDGVHTKHYKATIDSTQTTDPGGATFGGQTYTEEVWIDDDGIVRRVSYVLDASKAGSASGLGGVSGQLHVTFDLANVGQPVDIQVPPPDQVTSAGDLGGLTGGAGGLPGGLGGPAGTDPFGGLGGG